MGSTGLRVRVFTESKNLGYLTGCTGDRGGRPRSDGVFHSCNPFMSLILNGGTP